VDGEAGVEEGVEEGVEAGVEAAAAAAAAAARRECYPYSRREWLEMLQSRTLWSLGPPPAVAIMSFQMQVVTQEIGPGWCVGYTSLDPARPALLCIGCGPEESSIPRALIGFKCMRGVMR
jgi:hypothetical protein